MTLLFCTILTGCVSISNRFLHIQTYPNKINENNIGSVEIYTRCFHFTRFWNDFHYDLNTELLLYKDSVWICQKGIVSEVTLLAENSSDNDNNQIQLSGKGTLYLRFYSIGSVNSGDTIMLHTKNSIFTPSGVFPLDSVQFVVVGERFRFKDYFVGRKKGGAKYGYYTISL